MILATAATRRCCMHLGASAEQDRTSLIAKPTSEEEDVALRRTSRRNFANDDLVPDAARARSRAVTEETTNGVHSSVRHAQEEACSSSRRSTSTTRSQVQVRQLYGPDESSSIDAIKRETRRDGRQDARGRMVCGYGRRGQRAVRGVARAGRSRCG